MGDGRQKNNPAHKVTLSAFEIRKYPVTNQEYWEFVKAGHHAPPEHWVGDAPPPEIRNHPVVYVSWDDAQAWCEWATGRYDLPGLSLPTEAQWERAARGTDGREFPWKGPWNRHYCLNSEVREASSTGPVGVFPSGASPAGCLDMAGNVWEWCADWYGEDYYRKAPARDPAGPASGVSRVLRGGSWSNDLTGHFRCACRVDDSPDRIIGILGFRAARTVR